MKLQQNPGTAVPPPAIPSRFPAATGDIAIYLLRVGSDNQARAVISLDGRLDAERIKRAVRLSLDAEPVLGCRFVEHWWRPYWERLPNLDEAEFFRLVEPENPQQEVDRFILDNIDPTVGPQAWLGIVRAETDTLVLRMNHEVGDGGATKELLAKILTFYYKLGEDPAFRPAPNLTGSRSMRQISRRLSFREKLRLIRRAFLDSKIRTRPPGNWAFPSRNAPPRGPHFSTRIIGPARFAALRTFCRRHGFSVNDVLVAAFSRALFLMVKPAPGIPLRLRMTADQRRLLPSRMGEAITNLSGGYVLRLTRGLGDTLEETVRRVHEKIEVLKKDFIGLGPWITMPFLKWIPFGLIRGLLHRLLGRLQEAPALPPQISNGGVLLKELLVFEDVKATDFIFAGPLINPPNFQFNILGVDETVCLSVSFYESGIDPDTIEELFDRIERELPREDAP